MLFTHNYSISQRKRATWKPETRNWCCLRVARCALYVAPLLLRSKRDLRSASTGYELWVVGCFPSKPWISCLTPSIFPSLRISFHPGGLFFIILGICPARGQGPSRPPDMEEIEGRQSAAGPPFPLGLRPHLMAGKTGLDEPQVVFNGMFHSFSVPYTNPMLIFRCERLSSRDLCHSRGWKTSLTEITFRADAGKIYALMSCQIGLSGQSGENPIARVLTSGCLVKRSYSRCFQVLGPILSMR